MHPFSYKVNKRRHARCSQRRSLQTLIISNESTSDEDQDVCSMQIEDTVSDEEREQPNERFDGSTAIPENFQTISHSSNNDPSADESDWISDDGYQGDSRPLHHGSAITLTNAIHLIVNFYLSANLDKEKVNSLLRLIKSLLPRPNRLPTSWKSMAKAVACHSTSSAYFLCSDCYQSLSVLPCTSSKTCLNVKCSSSFRQRRSSEIVEIVPFDIRAQIQSIMTRNTALLNKSHLFPPNDICFGERYRNACDTNNNKITLVLHSDGAPLVRSSKQAIWPCFASIVELPPPVREYQANIIVLALWASRKKPDVNVFMKETIHDLSFLMQNGTSIFLDDREFHVKLATQFFVSDLPAKALFCRTTYFNGYSACTFCCSRGKSFSFHFSVKTLTLFVYSLSRQWN